MTKNALITFSVGLDKSPFVNLRCLCNLNLYDQFFHRFLSKAILTLLFRRRQRISFERHLLYISCKRQYEVLMLRQVYEKPVSRCLWIWSQQVVAPLIWCYHFVFTVRKVMFLHLSVILSTGGVCLSTPPRQPPGADISPGADRPVQCMLGDTVNKRAVCILLECNLIEYEKSWLHFLWELKVNMTPCFV